MQQVKPLDLDGKPIEVGSHIVAAFSVGQGPEIRRGMVKSIFKKSSYDNEYIWWEAKVEWLTGGRFYSEKDTNVTRIRLDSYRLIVLGE